jgi:hypothetical protein
LLAGHTHLLFATIVNLGRGREFSRRSAPAGGQSTLTALQIIRKGISKMRQPVTSLLLAGVLLGSIFAPATAAEREQVRIVVNLMAAVKMPYPENLARNRARTQRVWLDHNGAATIACLRLEARRWCYDHIPPVGARAEMLRIRNEAPGISVGALFHYVDDFDLDGMIDVGSTTRIEGPERAPIANVIQFFHRATNRGAQSRDEYQKMYDDGIQIALKYLGE